MSCLAMATYTVFGTMHLGCVMSTYKYLHIVEGCASGIARCMCGFKDARGSTWESWKAILRYIGRLLAVALGWDGSG